MPEGPIELKMAGDTDTGLRRSQNEDHIGFNQSLGVAVLADGMGGHQAGEIAAHMAVESVLEHLEKLAQQAKASRQDDGQRLDFIANAISYSNSMINQAAEALEEHKGMGTTLVAAIVLGTKLYAGHVGDSRLYLFRDRSLNRITKDHSLVQDLVDRGFYSEEEARVASVGHIVTRALGTKAAVEVDTVQKELQDRDLILLCSDGLSDMVADWRIEEALAESSNDLQGTAAKLIELANQQGGKDNISVVLMRVQLPEPSAS